MSDNSCDPFQDRLTTYPWVSVEKTGDCDLRLSGPIAGGEGMW
jgi:hypothetical protein